MPENEITIFKNKVIDLITLLVSIQSKSKLDTSMGWRIVKMALYLSNSDRDSAEMVVTTFRKLKKFESFDWEVVNLTALEYTTIISEVTDGYRSLMPQEANDENTRHSA